MTPSSMISAFMIALLTCGGEQPAKRNIKTHTICYGKYEKHAPYLDFIASHYDIVLADNPKIAEELTHRNPDIKVLYYKIAPAMHEWYPDWVEVDRHEEWYVHAKGFPPTREHRLSSSAQDAYNERMMDVRHPGWQDHYSHFVVKAMADMPFFAGIFADNCWAEFPTGPGRWHRTVPADQSIPVFCEPPDDLLEGWQEGLTTLLTKAKAALPNKLLIGNSGSSLYCRRYLNAIDGMFVEGFLHAPWGKTTWCNSEQCWLDEIQGLVHAQKNNKWYMAHCGITLGEASAEQIEQLRMFCYASFLLGAEQKATFQFIVQTNDNMPCYYPEWELPLGSPEGGYSVAKIDTSNIYRRNYSHGLVLVNPSDNPTAVEIDLTKKYRDWKGQLVDRVQLGSKQGTVLIRLD